MAETLSSLVPAQEVEQPSLPTIQEQGQEPGPGVLEPVNLASPANLNEAAPVDPAAPAAPVAPHPAPEEEELDELIIEDFTIDGICGVY